MSGRKICQDVEKFDRHSVRVSGGAGLSRGRRKGSSCTYVTHAGRGGVEGGGEPNDVI